jgi:hypothetical protein
MSSSLLRSTFDAWASSCWFGETVGLQAGRRLQPEQAAADDDGGVLAPDVAQHAGGVVEAAEAEHTRGQLGVALPHALHGREERAAAGGQDELVVRGHRAVVAVHHLAVPVDADDADTGVQRDVVLVVPATRVEEDLVLVVEAVAVRGVPGLGDRVGRRLVRRGLVRRTVAAGSVGEHLGEQDAVVVAVGLVAEDGDGELLGAAPGEDLLDGPGAGHPVADDDEPTRRRRGPRRLRTFRGLGHL